MRKQMSELLNSNGFDDGQKIGSEKTLRRWRSACNGRRSFHKLAGLDKLLELQEQVGVQVVLHCRENLSPGTNDDVPSSEYVVTEAATEAGIFQEPIDDVGSTVNDLEIFELLDKYKKRALAVFYLVLEAASFLLDIFGKSKRSILLAAFLLSALGFAVTTSTHSWPVSRTIAATRMHLQKRLLMVLEISFSLVQLVVTLIYFILAELGVKNNFNTSVFPLVFAIIAAVFTFKYDGEVSDSSGLDSALVALAAGNQVHMPNVTRNEDPEANGSMPMLADFR